MAAKGQNYKAGMEGSLRSVPGSHLGWKTLDLEKTFWWGNQEPPVFHNAQESARFTSGWTKSWKRRRCDEIMKSGQFWCQFGEKGTGSLKCSWAAGFFLVGRDMRTNELRLIRKHSIQIAARLIRKNCRESETIYHLFVLMLNSKFTPNQSFFAWYCLFGLSGTQPVFSVPFALTDPFLSLKLTPKRRAQTVRSLAEYAAPDSQRHTPTLTFGAPFFWYKCQGWTELSGHIVFCETLPINKWNLFVLVFDARFFQICKRQHVARSDWLYCGFSWT